ncbi:hypothetical protein [Natrinema ejinorense]|uniref:Uncharacterized protein n=1 Tax=Natrinema ejinorense TaxID=373386 RepID=A0A2A5QRM4_9EURY|nr:hypothetical protein [Natrinema ejinorense]PCR89454.1 hypothetical protein CP557_02210 [Natrinema ejinorense]
MTYQILVFEDNDSNYESLKQPLLEDLDTEMYTIDHFEGDTTAADGEDDASFVKRLLEETGEPGYPLVVILDAELNEYTLSTVRRPDVRDACGDLGIPLCVYHRDEGEYANPESVKDSDDQIIQLRPVDGGHRGMAAECAGIIEGFRSIREHLVARMEDADAKELLERPSEFLTDMADVPVSAKPNLDKYSWGQSESLSVLTEDEMKEDAIRRKGTILGYWMYNQVLEYPGVLVNSVAAASYLDVDVKMFCESDEIQALFSQAAYEGPFSGVQQWWWTAELDSVLTRNTTVDDEGTISAREFIKREEFDIDPVECLEGHKDAGYYCVLSKEPVCEEHSVSPEAWIPAGASLTRISEEEYMKLSGW